MENLAKQERPRKTLKLAAYINRIGHEYFVHQGITKIGKPKYFASQKQEGALEKMPHGFIFGESINGVVTIQRPKPVLVSEVEIELVKQKLTEFPSLKHYRVEAKGKEILIYEPMGMESINELAKASSYSMLDDLRAMLGPKFDDALSKAANDMGISVRDLKFANAYAARKKRKKSTEQMIRNIQYDAVMKFTFNPSLEQYQVERRCYRGEEHWLFLGSGPIEKMLKKFIRHIGKESFFELM